MTKYSKIGGVFRHLESGVDPGNEVGDITTTVRELKAADVFVITDVRLQRRFGSTTAFLARNFNVKQDALANADGTIYLCPGHRPGHKS